jgi:hypothetical protein
MGIGKDHATARQPIHVGRTCLGMTIQETNPVIQIIDGNKQYIRRRGALDHFTNQQARQADREQGHLLNLDHGVVYPAPGTPSI